MSCIPLSYVATQLNCESTTQQNADLDFLAACSNKREQFFAGSLSSQKYPREIVAFLLAVDSTSARHGHQLLFSAQSALKRAKNVGRDPLVVDQEPIPLEFCWLYTHHRRIAVENYTTVAHLDEVEDALA